MSKPPRLIFLLNSAQRRLQQFIAAEQERAARAGMGAPSPAQSGVLFVLAREDGATMGRLAQALDLAPSAMSGLVQRMEAQRWVARRASEIDSAGMMNTPSGDISMKSRMTANCRKASIPTTNFW